MKRELKKWLLDDALNGHAGNHDLDSMEAEERALLLLQDIDTQEKAVERLQDIWCKAQKQFLKELLNGMDDDINELFGSKSQVTRNRAELVAYISSLKAYFHSKYLLLKRKK